jgi:hypothetical protein
MGAGVSFLADYLAGRADAEQIHDHIGEWHDAPEDGETLHAHLGMTWEQYAAWVERSELPQRGSDGG